MRFSMLVLVWLTCLLTTPAQAQTSEGVFGIRSVTLKPGVDPTAFERFVVDEFVPKASRFYPGGEVVVVKSDRGEQVSNYLLFLNFDTKAIRDLYFPTPDSASPAFEKIMEAYGGRDTLQGLFDAFKEYAEIGAYTDYVAIEP